MRTRCSLFKLINDSSPQRGCFNLLLCFGYNTSALKVVENSEPAKNVVQRIPRKFTSFESVERRKRKRIVDQSERLRRFTVTLNKCTVKGCLNKGKVVHGKVVKSGITPDQHLWVSLISLYSKHGSLICARRVFDGIPERGVVAWTALISGFVGRGYDGDGLGLFCVMRREGVRPNEFTLASGLKGCSMCGVLGFEKQVHAEVVKLGFDLDLFVGSCLVDVYSKCGEMELANRVFFEMPEKNVVSWNALLNGYAETGDGEEVFKLFCKMEDNEMRFSKFTLSTVLKGCANSGNLRDGQVLHSLAIRSGCDLDEFVSCSLVDMYSSYGLADSALRVFKRIKDPDVMTWSAMIACLGQLGRGLEALQLFRLMIHAGARPNEYSFASLISAASDLDDLQLGESLHSLICKYGFESDRVVGNALITMYMKNGCLQAGSQLFQASTDLDTVSWNALLSGFHEIKTCNRGQKIFQQMLAEGFEPNICTFISVLKTASSLLDIEFGRQVHAQVIKNRSNANDFVGTVLIDMYARSGCLEDAESLFNKFSAHDSFTWSVMIAGYVQTNQVEKALRLLKQMQRDGVKPNEFMLSSCFSGCSRMATLQNGQQLHSVSIKVGHFADIFVSTALVDMYIKCGCLDDAEAIFEGAGLRDTVLWNTMIFGYCQHGQGEKALKTFKMMLNEGNKPDDITFSGALSACSHMGLVEEGKQHFSSLGEYGITATTDHFAAMVNILGRAGKFGEVESFIHQHNLGEVALVWESVLGTCKLHGNLELGERAAEKLFGLGPYKDANYILLSNIYAAKGRWNDVRKVRALMTSVGVKKKPACSWLEVDGQYHVFMSQDSLHPNMRDICSKLEELVEKLTLDGYVPNTEHVFHNVTERNKIKHLYNHSERLALAFALLSAKKFKTIRIFKNLRMCGDCHEFMKFVSTVTNREIAICDIACFHHFKSGACSCHDYW